MIGAHDLPSEETKRGETMRDERGKAMTIPTWQDNHSRYRRHKLMTKELGDQIPHDRSKRQC